MTSTKNTTIDEVVIGKLRASLTGPLLRDGDPGYDDARTIYNAMFDLRPGLIAQCQSTADVVNAINVAREHDLLVAVKGGGHSIAGFSVCDGGLMIDLSPMKSIHVDPEARTARAEPGVVLGELDAATQAFGLATPLGFVSPTGIAGLTLNGGIGWLARKYGLTCDNLVSAEVVLANGDVVIASETENPDLFWGLRGGGGNFGIVTSFEYRLHPVTEVYGDMQFFSADKFRDVLRHFARVAPTLPDEAVLYAATMTIPDSEMFPAELHGQFSAFLFAGYVGTQDDGERVLSVLHGADAPPADLAMAMSMPYQAAQTMQDEDTPPGRQNYWKSGNLDELTDEWIGVFVEHALTTTSPHCSAGVMTLGGAVARIPETATAYAGRAAKYVMMIDNIWTDPAENETQIAWTKSFFAALTPHLSAGAYLNFNSEVPADRVAELYGLNFARLQQLKDRYDPTNLFARNQNIKPSGS